MTRQIARSDQVMAGIEQQVRAGVHGIGEI